MLCRVPFRNTSFTLIIMRNTNEIFVVIRRTGESETKNGREDRAAKIIIYQVFYVKRPHKAQPLPPFW